MAPSIQEMDKGSGSKKVPIGLEASEHLNAYTHVQGMVDALPEDVAMEIVEVKSIDGPPKWQIAKRSKLQKKS
eukprot:m.430298 g.430298  ORF g.430298 m.430298 type:complete len:73 (-) comp17144_c0_seq1:1233-1451(-)